MGQDRVLPLPDVTSGLPVVLVRISGGHRVAHRPAAWFNPGGSVKDRPALSMIEGGAARGLLRPGRRFSRPHPAIPASAWL